MSWCMLFSIDIVLVDEFRLGLNAKLERWRQESKLKSKYDRVHGM